MKLFRRLLAILMALAVLAALAGFGWLERTYPARVLGPLKPDVVAVAAGDSVAVCPGELKLAAEQAGGDVSYDPRFDPRPTSVEATTVALSQGVGAAAVVGLDQAADGLLEGSTAGAGAASGGIGGSTHEVGDQPLVVRATSGSDAPALATGGTATVTADGDLRGIAAAACVTPAVESWLVGGSTELGSSARLVLVNPGLTSVTASVKLWDAAGPVDAVGLTGLVIPPGSSRAILLEGIEADASRLAAQVIATGGELGVYLQHSRLNGLTPAGVDLAVPGAAPATAVVVPGLDVQASSFDSAQVSLLRVLNPSDAPAVVSVVLWGPSGPVSLPGLDAVTIGAGMVADLSLGGLAEGSYVAHLASETPIVAAGLSLRVGQAPSADAGVGVAAPEDFGWSASGAVSGLVLVAWPQLGDGTQRLVLGSATDTEVAVSLVGTSGVSSPVTVNLSAGRSVVVSPADLVDELWSGSGEPVGLRLDVPDDAAVGAALVLVGSDNQTIAVLTPAGRAAAAQALSLYPAL
ncbi:MAG: DUF5719 family protein [Bifidobacteriaceae bacterium]|jgi:hypothetical protein|nr:DUF5719 family protein [Bifidobacteriaceae bacterium]